jgi:murein DD-endopeptidase MepM/ murein hydrolase activator NlpD
MDDQNLNTDANKNSSSTMKSFGRGLLSVGKIAVKVIFKKVALPLFFIIGVLLLFTVFSISIFFGNRGKMQEYNLQADTHNEFDQTEDGLLSTDISDDNQLVDIYYKFLSMQSYYKTIDEGSSLISYSNNIDEFAKYNDYYNKENIFYLNPYFLLSLDETLHEYQFKYPEQFIKPVNANLEEKSLVHLAGEKGELTAESFLYREDGTISEEKDLGVWDYGFAPILYYENYEKENYVKGLYVKKDIIEDNTVKTIELDKPEPFRIKLPNSKEEIYLIEHAITQSGEIGYEYSYQDVFYKDYQRGGSPLGKENTPHEKYQYDVGTTTREPTLEDITSADRDKMRKKLEEKLKEKEGEDATLSISRSELDQKILNSMGPIIEKHPLYKYREGSVIEYVPVEINTKENFYGIKYFEDYTTHYQAYVPENVLADFSFSDRVEEDFDVLNELNELNAFKSEPLSSTRVSDNLNVSSKIESSAYEKTNEKYVVFKKYADQFDIDVDILIAIAAQVSKGDHEGNCKIFGNIGIMGIDKDLSFQVKDVNSDIFEFVGNKDKLCELQYNIKSGAAYLKYLQNMYDGNLLLAIQAYTSGKNKTNDFLSEYAEETDMYREEVIEDKSYPWLSKREDFFNINEANFINNVLTYYPNSVEELLEIENGSLEEFNSVSALTQVTVIRKNRSWLSKVWDNIKEGFINTKETIEDFYKNKYEGNIFVYKNSLSTLEKETVLAQSIAFAEGTDYYSSYDYIQEQRTVEGKPDTSFLFLGSNAFSSSIGSAQAYIEGVASDLKDYINPTRSSFPISSGFGPRVHPITGEPSMHNGVDYVMPTGTGLYAVGDGEITFAGNRGDYGKMVEVNCGEYSFRYGHLSEIVVSRGEVISKGQIIGLSGNTGASTGPHLHFELWYEGERIDPQPYFFN